jgi:hypothetical protein
MDVASARELLNARRDLLRAVEALVLDQVRGQAGDVRGRYPRQQRTGGKDGGDAPIDVPEIVLVLLVLLPPVRSIHALVIAVPGARMSTTILRAGVSGGDAGESGSGHTHACRSCWSAQDGP